MSSEHNKFEGLFEEAESSNDVRTIYFTYCDGLSESELTEFRTAYEAALDRTFKAESEVMWRLVGVR